MNRRKYQPATYVVRWGDVWKAGFTSGKRWRSFELRGAEVINVTTYDSGLEALATESLIESWLAHLGHRAFRSKVEAAPWLGNQGGGWTECYCLCDVGPSQGGRFCDSHFGIPRGTPTNGTYETDGEISSERANPYVPNARTSQTPDLSSEAAIESWAASLTGCVLVDWCCATHNLSWVMCRWMEIAAVVHRALREGSQARDMRLR
jgi:hypothetical protein